MNCLQTGCRSVALPRATAPCVRPSGPSRASALQPVSTQRRVAAAAKSGGLDVQLSWPYGLLLAEVACVATQARTPLAVLSILLVILQTPQDNYLLKQLSNSSTFGRYKDAKTFLNVFTVFTFGAFLACSFVMSKSG